jgi:SHS2 domain-containing protein
LSEHVANGPSGLPQAATLSLTASSLTDLLVAAALAVGRLLGGPNDGPSDRLPVLAEGVDPAALLANLLDDLVYLSEAEAFIARRIERFELDDLRLRASFSGASSSAALRLAPVYPSDVLVECRGRGWTAQITAQFA